MITIYAYALFEGWKLYTKGSYTEPLYEYKFNTHNGEIYDSSHTKVGKMGQTAEEPYIYMDDNSYLCLHHSSIDLVKQSQIALIHNNNYLNNIELDA